MNKNGYYVTVTLTLDPRSPISIAKAVSNHLTKTASKSVHPFGWNFVHKNSGHTDTQTDRHTNRHTDKLK